jgi:Spy/CpxP family protein refolding chaperone
MRGINLSDVQKQQIRAIMEANRPTQENKERIRSLLTAKRNGTITPEQEAELRQIREAARQRSEAVRSQIQAVLTEEQKAEIERRKQEWRERRQNRRNKPGNPVVNN